MKIERRSLPRRRAHRIRRDIHAHPELGFERSEPRRSWRPSSRNGLRVTTGIGKTGVVGTIRVGNNRAHRAAGRHGRAAMDEHNTFDYRSQHGAACTPVAMTATPPCCWARQVSVGDAQLRRHRPSHLQPAEEGAAGAEAMVQGRAVREVSLRADLRQCTTGPSSMSASSPSAPARRWRWRPVRHQDHRKGAHGARPESGIDPVIIATRSSRAANRVSRNVAALDSAVISVTQMHAGDAYM